MNEIGSLMIQTIQQTRDEKISLYMRTQKRKLAEMLVNCNEIIEALQSHNSRYGEICHANKEKK